MDPRIDPLETLLGRLGQAHRDGAFADSVGAYPWQTIKSPAFKARSARRLAWVRVAAPLAAAAAVAVLFVGKDLFHQPVASEIAKVVPAVSAKSTSLLVDAQPSTSVKAESPAQTQKVNCDFNGDGVINGEDI